MNVTIIGDVHGHIKEYKEITDQCDISICVGDFGFEKEWDWHTKYIKGNHSIVMGNHDYYPYLDTHPASLRNWNFLPGLNIFTIRGAKSIDKHLRVEGRDWFANEELTYAEGLEAFDAYVKYKPKIVISHDCPQSVIEAMFKYAWMDKSITTQLLQTMFEAHQPNLFIFGHHHSSKDMTINSTRFICLNELETFNV